jgi:protein gp37
MAENSKIAWTDHTFNPWWGCNKVSAECVNCYIGPIMRRGGREPFNGPMRTLNWAAPYKWQRRAVALGIRYRVFTCSMSDFFHRGADAWRADAWQLIKECDQLDWLILSKRANMMASRLPPDWGAGYPNVWLGIAAGVKKSLWRLDRLRGIPAAVRFCSAEPLLEALNFGPNLGWLDWIITGCEQAAKEKRRVMQMEWVRAIDRQCGGAGVAHFHKQHYDGTTIVYDGLIDGVVRQEWPAPRVTIRPGRLENAATDVNA